MNKNFNRQPKVLIKSFIKSIFSIFIPLKIVVWCRRKPGVNKIALTFDDGPNQAITPKLLELLNAHDAKATFFILGKKVRDNTALLKRMQESGHQIASHSYCHSNFSELTDAQIAEDVCECNKVLNEVVGKVSAFRPPYGDFKWIQLLQFMKHKLTVVMWNIDSKDYESETVDQVLSNVDVTRLKGGDVILFHDNSDVTVQAIDRLIPLIKQKGFELSTVDNLIK